MRNDTEQQQGGQQQGGQQDQPQHNQPQQPGVDVDVDVSHQQPQQPAQGKPGNAAR